MEQYSKNEFESFMKAMKRLSDVLRSKKPTFIFAPVVGSVPLIDVLSIMNRHFPLETVEYPPNSSRFLKRQEMMKEWYHNFLNAQYHGESIDIVCVDEVISGSSAVKGYIEFRKALHEYRLSSNYSNLEKKISYEILGIGEKPRTEKRNRGFVKLVNKGKAKVFETERIITSDNRDLNPVRLKQGEKNRQERQTYLPEIESLNYGEKYLSFLHNVAAYCGSDPDKVNPVNLLKMQRSLEGYLR